MDFIRVVFEIYGIIPLKTAFLFGLISQIFSLSTVGLVLEILLTVAFIQFTCPTPMGDNELIMFGTIAALSLVASDSLGVNEFVNKASQFENSLIVHE